MTWVYLPLRWRIYGTRVSKSHSNYVFFQVSQTQGMRGKKTYVLNPNIGYIDCSSVYTRPTVRYSSCFVLYSTLTFYSYRVSWVASGAWLEWRRQPEFRRLASRTPLRSVQRSARCAIVDCRTRVMCESCEAVLYIVCFCTVRLRTYASRDV
jgi:hypothetical protein